MTFKETVNFEIDSFINKLKGALMYKGGDYENKDFNDISAYDLIQTCFRNKINLTCEIIPEKKAMPWQ